MTELAAERKAGPADAEHFPDLAGPEQFPDVDEELDRRRRALECVGPLTRSEALAAMGRRISSSCCGWRPEAKPTPEGIVDAIHHGGGRDLHGIWVAFWWNESSDAELLQCWRGGLYSWRALVRAVHDSGNARRNPRRNRFVNTCRSASAFSNAVHESNGSKGTEDPSEHP